MGQPGDIPDYQHRPHKVSSAVQQRGAVDHGDQLISIMVAAFDLVVLDGFSGSQCFLWGIRVGHRVKHTSTIAS